MAAVTVGLSLWRWSAFPGRASRLAREQAGGRVARALDRSVGLVLRSLRTWPEECVSSLSSPAVSRIKSLSSSMTDMSFHVGDALS